MGFDLFTKTKSERFFWTHFRGTFVQNSIYYKKFLREFFHENEYHSTYSPKTKSERFFWTHLRGTFEQYSIYYKEFRREIFHENA